MILFYSNLRILGCEETETLSLEFVIGVIVSFMPASFYLKYLSISCCKIINCLNIYIPRLSLYICICHDYFSRFVPATKWLTMKFF